MLRRFTIRRRRPSIKTFSVRSLDGTTLTLNLDSRSSGKDLLDKVLQECGITTDKIHFSLALEDENYLKWILLHKPLRKQMSGSSPYSVNLRVHIYPYNHHSLFQSLSRHYLYLQVKQDLRQNRLQPSSSNTATRIAALVVQGEIGNYIPHTCSNGYIQDLQILPNVTSGTEEAIKQAHRLNRGRLPGECEEEVLDVVQEEPTYGSVYYNVQDSHREPVILCVCPVGVRVAQGGRQVNCFKWESLAKVGNRGKHLYLHIDASQTVTAYQAHYTCQSSQMALNISNWCQTLMHFYCHAVQEDFEKKSRLKRFFSSRRSLRRPGPRPNPSLREQHPGTDPVSRRGRRASLGGLLQQISSKNNSPSHTPRMGPGSRTDSKLVIYGLSGLASAEALEQQSHDDGLTTASASASSLPDNNPLPPPPAQQALAEMAAASSEGFGEEGEKRERDKMRESKSTLIQEEEFGGRSDITGRDNRSEQNPSVSTSGTASPRRQLRRENSNPSSPRHYSPSSVSSQRGLSRNEEFSDYRGDNQRSTPAFGSVGDVEHKSVSAVLLQQQRYAASRENQKLPSHPSRRHSEMDLTTKEEKARDAYYQKNHYTTNRVSPHHQKQLSMPHHNGDDEGGSIASDSRQCDQRSHRSTPHLYSPDHLQQQQQQQQEARQRHSHQQRQYSSPTHHQQRQYSSPSHRQQSPSHHYHHHSSPSPPSSTTSPLHHHQHHHRPPHHHHHHPPPPPHRAAAQHQRASPHHHHHHYSRSPPHHNERSSETRGYSSPSPSGSEQLPRHQHHQHPHSGGGGGGGYRHHGYHRSSGTSSSKGGEHPRSRSNTYSNTSNRSAHDNRYDRERSGSFSTSTSHINQGRPSSRSSSVLSGTNSQPSIRGASSYSSMRTYNTHSTMHSPDSAIHAPNANSHGSDGGIVRGSDSYSSLRGLHRPYSMEESVSSPLENSTSSWDHTHRQGNNQSPISAGGGGDRRHFRYPAANATSSAPHHYYKGSHTHNGAWFDGEAEVPSHPTSSSLPLQSYPDYSLYEEDEEMLEIAERKPTRSSGRHVSRHKRSRHSTITSLTSLSSDITGGMSRLGSIASLDHQASLAELSQADSIGGYIDPHVRSMVFDSQNSQGTEL